MASASAEEAGASILKHQAIAGVQRIEQDDPALFDILEREARRQRDVLSLIASSSVVDPSVMACMASVAVNVTAEGYPGRRYHAGAAGADEIEELAIVRATSLFSAHYANVQPHSASTANNAILTSLLASGDTILGMELYSGGHLSHGASAALAGTYFKAIGYGLDSSGRIDMDQVRDLAHAHRPKLIICGATAYSRIIDFAGFREIADEVGAVLLADISHVAGLVVAGLHPSPVDHAHITTACTHKQMFGPRGALIISGRDADELLPRARTTTRKAIQRSVFPFAQGAPALHTIAGKARAFELAARPAFREVANRILVCAEAIASTFSARGHRIVSGGTDNHLVLVDLGERMSGRTAEEALERCGIIVNRNQVPGDHRRPDLTGGIRLGTNTIARRGMGAEASQVTADLACDLLDRVEVVGDASYQLDAATMATTRDRVANLAQMYPMPDYSEPISASA